MEKFKAVNGWTDEDEIEDLRAKGRTANIHAQNITKDEEHPIPCTIIPGHWAERIESGELLIKGEWCALKDEYKEENSYADDSTMTWDEYLIKAIARKLGGEP